MDLLERLVAFALAQYRWGLHPLKILAALLIPVFVLWLGDRAVRARGDQSRGDANRR